MRKFPTFFLTLYQVISIQRQAWAIPAVYLGVKVEALLSAQQPATMSSGRCVQLTLSQHNALDDYARMHSPQFRWSFH